jgi:hypothetical protein
LEHICKPHQAIVLHRGLSIRADRNIFTNQVTLKAFYDNVEIQATWSIEANTIATITTNGVLTFSDVGSVNVIANYNGETATATISYIVYPMEVSGSNTIVGFIPATGSNTVRWGVTSGSYGQLNEYNANGSQLDYWKAEGTSRSVTLKSSTTQIKVTFVTSNLDNSYVFDVTSGEYLWKGKNVE